MNHAILLTILTTGFVISFFHASIPTHWLPFVLASKAQGWDRKKTIWVTLLAGSGHILMTTMLGVLIVWVGLQLGSSVGKDFSVFIAGALFAIGFYYLLKHWKGKKHSHLHIGIPFLKNFLKKKTHQHVHDQHCDHGHGHALHEGHGEEIHGIDVQTERMTILGLFLLMTLSPCEGFLPVYASGISYGWVGFLLLTIILGVATVAGMVVFTWLALKGAEKINTHFFEKYEFLIMGSLLMLLGIVVIFVD